MTDSNTLNFDLLFNQFPYIDASSLWILDENPPVNWPPVNQNITVISNRFDTVQLMQEKGFTAVFSDFDFSCLPKTHYQYIFYRISKEKALAHYIINQAKNLLAIDGTFIFSGAKQEGIKGYIDRAGKLFDSVTFQKADKQHWSASCSQPMTQAQPLDDKNYQHIRAIDAPDEQISFLSKPGVFGWNKIDSGSQLLVQQLRTIFASRPVPANVLDIGCGYGYLTAHCHALFNSIITSCDNNAAAVNACRSNAQQHGIKGQVIATNCTQGIEERFELVVCNPPFHSGFSVKNDLTEQFLRGAHKNLTTQGIAVFVVNLHIPLERKAAGIFNHIDTVYSDKHFKVITLQK